MDFDFDKLAYPETVVIDGAEYKAKRDTSKGKMNIPYSEEPDVGIGDVIVQKAGKREIHLKVTDVQFLEGGSLNVGTNHPHMLTLNVQNATAEPHLTNKASSTINIGSVSGEMVQIGDQNVQVANVSIKQLVEHVAKSGDKEAKSKLRALLENGTVASLVGAGATTLLGLL
ncbi:hypothetical protein A3724_14075 [Alcanivorax sp. HI0033]|jgi:hypothetical protein|uniref:hypothetical protein n=1 Tax=unclassified Alcanivorax TaxID=2638842 RepID=UPI0007B8429D|nr:MULTISPECIES: hypothetical protein [unclassified Alcanivorax]KZX80897.1 hypothetical protein A3717_01225 [Alcanivorax sp. HI0013]KZX81979.1 hypothetical protein A3716_29875 [Alcanivorax sp. HI0011]KZY16743.1 hypothetical protein A3725_18650 [Alcanivorax sp. HI0035]KZX69540.1 hypothetical protein A3713_01520 [Alcanivorax sp. HI0003]KZX71711.1 hypothetical protein A3714_05345 [Alcanivorax sp. HI0007]